MFDFLLLSLIHTNYDYFVCILLIKMTELKVKYREKWGPVATVPSGKTTEPKGTDQKLIQLSVQEKPGEMMCIFVFVFSQASGVVHIPLCNPCVCACLCAHTRLW